MTIEVSVDPQVEAELPVVAAAHGMKPEDFASKVITEAVRTELCQRTSPSVEEFKAALAHLAAMPSARIPAGETFSREMIYADDWNNS